MIYNIAIDGPAGAGKSTIGIIIYLCRYRSHVSCHGALSSAQRSQ